MIRFFFGKNAIRINTFIEIYKEETMKTKKPNRNRNNVLITKALVSLIKHAIDAVTHHYRIQALLMIVLMLLK